jgi:hypothetical protein
VGRVKLCPSRRESHVLWRRKTIPIEDSSGQALATGVRCSFCLCHLSTNLVRDLQYSTLIANYYRNSSFSLSMIHQPRAISSAPIHSSCHLSVFLCRWIMYMDVHVLRLTNNQLCPRILTCLSSLSRSGCVILNRSLCHRYFTLFHS